MQQNRTSDSNREAQGLSRLTWFVQARPKRTFAAMVAILVLSAMAATLHSVMRKPYSRDVLMGSPAPMERVTQGISHMWRSGAAISEAMGLEREITAIMDKDTLTDADSIALGKALDQLEAINNMLNPTKK